MNTHYRREIVLSWRPINGYYRYRNDFQILPPDDAAPVVGSMLQHYRLILEYSYLSGTRKQRPSRASTAISVEKREFVAHMTPESDVVEETQSEADSRNAEKRIREILAILSLLTMNRFFRYKSDHAWFLPIAPDENVDPTRTQPIWGQFWTFYPGFNGTISEFTQPSCASISFVDINRIDPHIGNDPLEFPVSINALLDRVLALPEEAYNAFVNAALLRYAADDMWGSSRTIMFVALISAIETLVEFEHRGEDVAKCKCCGQPTFQVTRKFRDFVEKYGGTIDCEYRKHIETLYSIRSWMLHRGLLRLADRSQRDFFDEIHIAQDSEDRYLLSLSRVCLINWLVRWRDTD